MNDKVPEKNREITTSCHFANFLVEFGFRLEVEGLVHLLMKNFPDFLFVVVLMEWTHKNLDFLRQHKVSSLSPDGRTYIVLSLGILER